MDEFILIQVTTFILIVCFSLVASIYHNLWREAYDKISKKRYRYLTMAWRCFTFTYMIQFFRNLHDAQLKLWHIWSFKLATSLGAIGIVLLFFFLASFYNVKIFHRLFMGLGTVVILFTIYGVVSPGYRIYTFQFGVYPIPPPVILFTSTLSVVLLLLTFAITAIFFSLKDISATLRKRIRYMCLSYIVFWIIGILEGSLFVIHRWGLLGMVLIRILYLVMAFPTIILWVGQDTFIESLRVFFNGITMVSKEKAKETSKSRSSEDILHDFFFLNEDFEEVINNFFAMAAHELHSPLTPLQTKLEMLSQGYYGETTEEQKKKIQEVLEGIEHLKRLGDDFSRIANLRTGHFELEKDEYKLAHTIKEVITQYKPVCEEENIFLNKSVTQNLEAVYDEKRIIQVLQNLVKNAIDFTKDRISIQSWEKTDTIYVSVQDNGSGIPEDAQQKIFQPFFSEVWKKGPKTREFGGTGLGLYICKRIIESHGGKIKVDAKPGIGSTFTFTLPKRRSQ